MIDINVEFFIYFFSFSVLCIASYQDIKKGEVDDWMWLLIFTVGVEALVWKANDIISYSVLFFCSGIIIILYKVFEYLYSRNWIGGADGKAILVLLPSLFLSGYSFQIGAFLLNVVSFWGLQSMMNFTVSKLKKTKSDTFPAIPLITIAYLYTLLFGTFI